MKNILNIYKSDIKKITRNSSVLIIAIGLIILPSLYAWFNIKASWDPYGNTKGIKVAIVNEDTGITINNKNVNIGNNVVNELKTNTQLGWIFLNSEEADRGLKTGKFYASITIPANFTKDMSSILNGDIKRGELIYTVNEKINAISPKITDKGASSLAETINKTVVETVSEVIFNTLHDIGFTLEEKLPLLQSLEITLKSLQSKFESIDSTVNDVSEISIYMRDVITSIQGDMNKIKSTLDKADQLSSTLNTSATDLKNWSNEISPIIQNDLNLMISTTQSINDLTQGLTNIGSQSKDESLKLLNSIENKLNSLKSMNSSLIKILRTIDIIKPNTDLKPITSALSSINDKINAQIANIIAAKEHLNNGSEIAEDILSNISKVSNDISNILVPIYDSYDTIIVPTITKVFNDVINVSTNTNDIVNSTKDNLPKIEEILNLTLSGLDKGDTGIETIKEKLPEIYTFINTVVEKLDKVNSSKEVAEILKLLQQNPLLRKDFLGQPVKIVEHKLYSIPNYGSAMTPFYTVLSLWVGILLLLSIFSTETHGDYSYKEIYLGKLLTFLTFTLLQALVVSLGDIFLLKAYMVNPVLFVLLNLLTSTCFTLIVYSLVSVLGNVGKAIGVVLLVLQVAGSGGTFPIEVTPKFFQILNPFLPFTYSISTLREAVSGVYMPNLITDVIILSLYGLVFMIFSIYLKKPINKLTKNFRDKFNESGLGAH